MIVTKEEFVRIVELPQNYTKLSFSALYRLTYDAPPPTLSTFSLRIASLFAASFNNPRLSNTTFSSTCCCGAGVRKKDYST
jgi:hypothetical protein